MLPKLAEAIYPFLSLFLVRRLSIGPCYKVKINGWKQMKWCIFPHFVSTKRQAKQLGTKIDVGLVKVSFGARGFFSWICMMMAGSFFCSVCATNSCFFYRSDGCTPSELKKSSRRVPSLLPSPPRIGHHY
jgi:hypothetical protein